MIFFHFNTKRKIPGLWNKQVFFSGISDHGLATFPQFLRDQWLLFSYKIAFVRRFKNSRVLIIVFHSQPVTHCSQPLLLLLLGRKPVGGWKNLRLHFIMRWNRIIAI